MPVRQHNPSPADPPRSPGSGPQPAWSEPELTDPHAHSEKPQKVRRMFSAIAGSYDLNNRVHSMWRDQAWRRHAVRAADVRPGDVVVDVACGTGDLTQAFARSAASKVVGIDFTHEMLVCANDKRTRMPPDLSGKIAYIEGDAQSLPIAAGVADVLSIAFGIRNVADPARAVREFARVLKPGGRLVILEFDRPDFPPARWLNDFYCGWVMPRTATLISGDRSGAYRYLPKSVGTFMPRTELCDLIARSGFRDVAARPLTMGICVCYRAIRV